MAKILISEPVLIVLATSAIIALVFIVSSEIWMRKIKRGTSERETEKNSSDQSKDTHSLFFVKE